MVEYFQKWSVSLVELGTTIFINLIWSISICYFKSSEINLHIYRFKKYNES